MTAHPNKIPFHGTVTSIQPRIRLMRSFDEISHSYQGYVLGINGTINAQKRPFLVAIGNKAHEKHQIKVGDTVSGEGLPVADQKTEIAELYKISKLKVNHGKETKAEPPPWQGVPPALPVYRERGHRRLSERTYESKCSTCIWGCRMPVEIVVDHWNPSKKKYRTETFCYGPTTCKFYSAGATRKVPGRNGMLHVEEDWVDEDTVSHRTGGE